MTVNPHWRFPGFRPRRFLPHDARRVDTHQHLSLSWMWLRCVFVDKGLGAATSMDTDGFHDVPLRAFEHPH